MKKLIPIISIIAISGLGFLFAFDSISYNKDILKSTFEIDATYYESGYIEILYMDKTNKTNQVVLEILGMEKSFQKIFSNSSFVETVQFKVPPKYGWQIHPITFLIDHDEFGKILLKTEIHDYGQPAPAIIYGTP